MPTNGTGQSRRLVTSWPVPTVVGVVYTLHFARPLGGTNPRGRAQHYTGFALGHRLAGRLSEHWDGTCGVPIVVAFRRAGIPFVVVSIERGVTRARENQLKLHGAARRCPVCCRATVDRSPRLAATLLTGQGAGRHQERLTQRQEQDHDTSSDASLVLACAGRGP